MIAQGRFNPAHLGAIGETVRCVLDEIGAESLGPGDVVLHNDPFRGGCHMPEHMLLRPVFREGRLVAYRRDALLRSGAIRSDDPRLATPLPCDVAAQRRSLCRNRAQRWHARTGRPTS